MGEDAQAHVQSVLAFLDQWPPVSNLTALAPVLEIPFAFEPELCQRLVQLHQQHGGQEIGVLREIEGQTVRINDRQSETPYRLHDRRSIPDR